MTDLEPAGAAAPGASGGPDDGRPWVLVLDTATSTVVTAGAGLDGELLSVTTWTAGRTHGASLLPSIGRLTGEANLRRSQMHGVVVGTGPGAFTGLRVGLASAKALAHELRIPIIGVSTGEALLAASGAGGRAVLLLPAGPNDRHLVRPGQAPVLLPGGRELELAEDEVLVAVDLVDRAPADALERGAHASAGHAAALAHLGCARLAAGDADDLAALVPEYVSLPRGVTRESGEVAWSRDPR